MVKRWLEPGSSFLVLTLCVACGGSSFGSAASGGAGGDAQAGSSQTSGGHTGSAGASSAGQTSAGGAANGGHSSSGGAASGGQTGAGGAANGGHTGSAGAANGGTIGSGGSSAGGTASAGSPAGGSGGSDCATLKVEYNAAVQKARICTPGGLDECSTGSTLPAVGCGCPTLVNAKSAALPAAKQKYQAIQDAKCDSGPICNIACLAYASAACMASSTAGAGSVCTGSFGAVN